MKKILILSLLFVLSAFGLCFAQISPAQEQRAQEILEKERTLQDRLKEPLKQFIEEIVVEGVTLLSEEELTKITAPFKDRWLNIEQIEQLVAAIKEAYIQKGYLSKPSKISSIIENKKLIITVDETEATLSVE